MLEYFIFSSYGVFNLILLVFYKELFYWLFIITPQSEIIIFYSKYILLYLIFFTLMNFILIHFFKYLFNRQYYNLYVNKVTTVKKGSVFNFIFNIYKFFTKDFIYSIIYLNFFTALVFLIYFFKLIIIDGNSFEIVLYRWFSINFYDYLTNTTTELGWVINCEFLVDYLTGVMFFVVIFISFLIHIYSLNYMGHDKQLLKFISYLSLFTFFMILLISSGNLLQLFFGWEGVGLCSYLLINFWHTRVQANKAALKAMFMNRIGDWGLLLGIVLTYIYFQTLNFKLLALKLYAIDLKPFYLFSNYSGNKFVPVLITTICILLLIGAIGKSAQFGLHTWLPDAMEGPTPVSALIHAATMVTAGVFLIIRVSFLFEYSEFALNLIIFFGGLTIIFGATTACFQYDIKKIVAFSTCSQLGYMFLACGLSQYNLALFHLFNHAFFKALLFMTSGALIHELKDEQDIRKMGGLGKLYPNLFIYFLIGSLSLMGITGLSGYYSKDLIIESSLFLNNSFAKFGFFCSIVGVFFTSFYSIRLLYYVFFGKLRSRSVKRYYTNWKISKLLTIPLFLLMIFSIFSGYIFKDVFLSLDIIKNYNFFYSNSITEKSIISLSFLIYSLIFLSLYLNYLIIVKSTIRSLNEFLIYFKSVKFLGYRKNITNNLMNFELVKRISFFFNKKYYIDIFYNNLSKKSLIFFYYKVFTFVDRFFLETFGPKGITKVMLSLGTNFRKLQTGHISDYSFFFVISIIVLNAYFLFVVINL